MTRDPNDAQDGRGALRDQLDPVEPPATLANRVLNTLDARELVRRGPTRGRMWAERVGLLAAGALMGVLTRDATSRDAAVAPSAVQQYVLLLYGDPVDDTGAVHDAREREYGRWASSLGNQVHWVGGHELGEVVAELPPIGSTPLRNDRLAGYFVITAGSRDQATAAARTVPHLSYGGRAVLMAVEP